jgi:outer membrane receptor protein involved in Fe transport
MKKIAAPLLPLWFILFCCHFGLQAQVIVNGELYDKSSGLALVGANVSVSGTSNGTATEWDGSFQLKVDQLPVLLEFQYTGYESMTFQVTDPKAKVMIELEPSVTLLETVQVSGSRVTDKRRESPLTVESMDLLAIKASTSNDFYEGLGSLKGVDLTTASMGFTVINTRGFNSTSPVRSLQIIDGVDNQSPGLNFSLGNFLGCPELDVLRVDLIQGASSAFYGPNAFNGVIDIQTKDPFLHQGISADIKVGERNLLKGEFRIAHVFKNSSGVDKFAIKLNGSYMRADDWEADNLAPTSQSDTDETNPGGYDAVNVYGDENTTGQDYSGNEAARIWPGLTIFNRKGYRETDLVDYDTENYKGNLGFYYKITPLVQANVGFNFGSGTTVYQGENRFRLDNIFFWQGKFEIKQNDKFFVRAYMTQEDAGDTYDIYATALQLQETAKLSDDWNSDYTKYWQSWYVPKVKKLEGYPIPWNFEKYEEVMAQNPDSLFLWHAQTQANTNLFKSPTKLNYPFFEPGTYRFDSLFNIITNSYSNDPDHPGTKFYDKSGLIHVHGEYKFETQFADFTTGANFRQYLPDSRGTIFSDTAGTTITNNEFGVYAGMDKKLIPAKLKLNLAARLDKNENFDLVVSPAASFVYTPNVDHTFRISFSSAVRNPTLADQYLNLNVGRAQLLGNITGYDSLITVESFVNYLNTLNKDTLDFFNEPPIQPEKVKTIELGYRGALFENFWVDAGYYYSFYTDFIGYKIGVTADFFPNNSYPYNARVYRISANAQSEVTTQGFSAGGNYFMGQYYNVSGNYSWNILNTKGTDDPIIPAFNTPEHKFNLGFSGRNMPVNVLGSEIKNIGFNVNYKWIEGFVFEGSPQFTGAIPTYDLLDAQVNWTAQKLGVTIKLGATNVLNKKQFQTYGGPRIGRLAYISFLYESKA